MDAITFRRILTTFADTPADIDIGKGRLLLQLRDDLLDARVFSREGSIHVEEAGATWLAEQWLFQRVARLHLLAERIISLIPEEPHFVIPAGRFLDELESAPLESEQPVQDAVACAAGFLARRPGGTAAVLYLTADAGEGKSTVIAELSRRQAAAYKAKVTDWLLVPISLGGRPFLRFDDVIVAALMNRLRFPLLYYDAFIELVRLGVLVPALDGFEEMFIEGPAGDAVSALGNLMQTLQSSGSVLIAARKAYFEYKRLETQAKLFDSLGSSSVAFSKLTLERWDRARFLAYGEKRSFEDAAGIYDSVAQVLGGADHPLLTRAVLVKRLLDVADQSETLEMLLSRLGASRTDYFAQFVRAIVWREAREKWIDRAGEAARPLITEDEHFDLLANVAHEMWTSGTESVREDVLEFAADLFCDAFSKSAATRRQVIERIKQHALIVRRDGAGNLFSFDHEEFYHFFLGYSVAQVVAGDNKADIRQTLRRAALPQLSMDVAALELAKDRARVPRIVSAFAEISQGESIASFVSENSGGLAIRLVSGAGVGNLELRSMTFPADSLLGGATATKFTHCYFQPTGLRSRGLVGARFEDCEFEHLDLGENEALAEANLIDCRVRAVTPVGGDDAIFAPELVTLILRNGGAELAASRGAAPIPEGTGEADWALKQTGRLFRAFMRSTELNEGTIRMKLGTQWAPFESTVLPHLVRSGIVKEVPYVGHGVQRRFRLGVPLRELQAALEKCTGDFDRFIDAVTESVQ
jgi:hypothetical protein